MPLQNVAPLEATIEIDAPPTRVWALVSNPRNMPRWSPQTAKTFIKGGGEVREGSRMININRRGLLVWPTQAKVVRFTPEQEIAWRVKENFTIWSYRLDPASGGTRLTVRREAPQGISDVSVRLTKTAFGGVDAFAEELVQGMNQTLTKIKADAER